MVLDTMAQLEQRNGNVLEADKLIQRAEKIREHYKPIAKATE